MNCVHINCILAIPILFVLNVLRIPPCTLAMDASLCRSITCSNNCTGVCGWAAWQNTCLPGHKTDPWELDLGPGCQNVSFSDSDCREITCSTKCSGPCGWASFWGACLPGHITTKSETEQGPGCRNSSFDKKDCQDIACSTDCIGPCGWAEQSRKCKPVGYTFPREYDIGPGCHHPNFTSADCRTITCSDNCSGPCGWHSPTNSCRSNPQITWPSELGRGPGCKNASFSARDCPSLTCAENCTGPCGWNSNANECEEGTPESGFTWPAERSKCQTTKTSTSTVAPVHLPTQTPTISPTSDGCNGISCAMFCNGTCGWLADSNTCVSGARTEVYDVCLTNVDIPEHVGSGDMECPAAPFADNEYVQFSAGKSSDVQQWENAGWKVVNDQLWAAFDAPQLDYESAIKYCESFGAGFRLGMFTDQFEHEEIRTLAISRTFKFWGTFWIDAVLDDDFVLGWPLVKKGWYTTGVSSQRTLLPNSSAQTGGWGPYWESGSARECVSFDLFSVERVRLRGKNCSHTNGFFCAGPKTADYPTVAHKPECQTPEVKSRPNIIVALADDMGYGDTPDNIAHLQMPAFKDMTRTSLRFTRYYTSPVCSPTRASIMTGRQWNRAGVPDVNSNGHLNDGKVKTNLPNNQRTIGKVFQDLCYRTAHFGKYHLGNMKQDQRLATPGYHGFDEWMSTVRSTFLVDPQYYYDSRIASMRRCGRLPGDDSMIIANRTKQFISDSVAQNTPFLALLWFHAPHTPLDAPQEYQDLYLSQTSDIRQRKYWGCLSAMDSALGSIRTHLRDLSVHENTIVWFSSDNGADSLHPFGNTAGLRGRKFSLFEGGIRTPSVLEWPAVVQHGRDVPELICCQDILPTLIDVVAGPEYLAASADGYPAFDGESMAPLVFGENYTRANPLAFHFRTMATWMDRTGRYKWGRLLKNGAPMLFDLVADPFEQVDLISTFPEIAANMSHAHNAWKSNHFSFLGLPGFSELSVVNV